MKQLDTNSATPLYLQLVDEIKQLISDGVWTKGGKIMTEQTLCDTYGISRITVRKAINLLVEENVLFRKQGKGTYVSYPEFLETAWARERSFTASTIHQSVIPYTRVIDKTIITVSRKLAETFRIPDQYNTNMIQIVRIRYLDSKPVIYELDYFPMRFEILLELNLDNQSLYETLHNKLGIDPGNFCDYFRITPALAQHARLLEVEPGHPLLSVVQTVMDADRKDIYYNEQLIKTESYEYGVSSFVD